MYIFITGANRGIGLYQTKYFLKDNDIVFANYRNDENLADLKELQHQFPNQLYLIKGDINNAKDVASFYEQINSKTKYLDILVNNAGIDLETHEPSILEVATDIFSETYQTNTISMVSVVQTLLPLLKNNPHQALIANTSSGIGSMTNEITMTRYAYMMSKAAVNMFSRVLAYELKETRIITIAWSPGWVKTRLGTEKATLTLDEAGAQNVNVLKNINPSHNGLWLDVSGEIWNF